ncbi:carbonic anhydrase [Moraxella oblonga]|uniref:carbonic anhydrase n=1 Tax=Moraxella oblonga TaxID=200413 RepID=UPI00083252C5|nr:carbonic anhydrase family protein [Moraxella oblonga]
MKRFVLSSLALSLILTGCTTTLPIVEDTHVHDHHHDWDYEHPEKWGDEEVNKLCSAGQEQSPIDIKQALRVEPTSDKDIKLTENYQAQDFTVKNNGHTIVFDVANQSKSQIVVNGTTYDLLQFHYHIPSEHTVMNTHYPLEIHFVHKSQQGNLAVVGVLFNTGKHNDPLQQIITGLPNEGENGTLSNFNIGSLMPKDSNAYAYNGSLTTPPCLEKVQWLLKADPVDASGAQLRTLAKLYDGNNRPVQPPGDRQIILTK